MKTRAMVTALALVNTLAAPALAAQGTPGTPPPGTGIVTPYNSDREASPVEFPSASISGTVQCGWVHARQRRLGRVRRLPSHR